MLTWGILEHPGQECKASCMKISQSQQNIFLQFGHSYTFMSFGASNFFAQAKQCFTFVFPAGVWNKNRIIINFFPNYCCMWWNEHLHFITLKTEEIWGRAVGENEMTRFPQLYRSFNSGQAKSVLYFDFYSIKNTSLKAGNGNRWW